VSPKSHSLPPKNHQYRLGHVQRQITRAFIAADRELSTCQLVEWAFPLQLYQGRTSYHDRVNYCRAIRRAADRLCDRVGRSDKGTGRPVLWRLKTPPK
jgi:hypothetical protein